MNIKNLSSATKILSEIERLDNEIIALDKLCRTILNDETECSFTLSVKNITKQKEKTNEVRFDEDGSLIQGGYGFHTGWGIFHDPHIRAYRNPLQSSKEKTDITQTLTGNMAIHLISFLISQKKQDREINILKLNSMGFKI